MSWYKPFQGNVVNSTDGHTNSDQSALADDEPDARLFKRSSMEHVTSHTHQQDITGLIWSSIGGEQPRIEERSDPSPARLDHAAPEPVPKTSSGPISVVESSGAKVVTKPRGLEKMVRQLAKLRKRRDEALDLRVRGKQLRNELAFYRGDADTIMVKLQELLRATSPAQALQDAMSELQRAQAVVVELNLSYDEHEVKVNVKEYELTEMEERFTERYGELVFADDLVLDRSTWTSDDSMSDSSEEWTPLPTIPANLDMRDKYVHLRAKLEDLHHERSYYEIRRAREQMEQPASEVSSDTSNKLADVRRRESALAEQIKDVEAKVLQLEKAAIAAGEMSATLPVAEGENITLGLAQVQPNRHPLLFPFPEIDQDRLQLKAASEEDDLPVGVTDWSLYRLRSTALDVDYYKANSEPGMWSKPGSPKSQWALDQQLKERVLNSWRIDAVTNGAPMLGPLTSDLSEDGTLPMKISKAESTDGRDREFPKVSELLRSRRSPLPRDSIPAAEPTLLTRSRSAPDLDGSARREHLY